MRYLAVLAFLVPATACAEDYTRTEVLEMRTVAYAKWLAAEAAVSLAGHEEEGVQEALDLYALEEGTPPEAADAAFLDGKANLFAAQLHLAAGDTCYAAGEAARAAADALPDGLLKQVQLNTAYGAFDLAAQKYDASIAAALEASIHFGWALWYLWGAGNGPAI